MANAKVIVATLASLPRAVQPLARENHNEQRIKAIPKKSASSTKMQKTASACADLPPVFPERQSFVIAGKRHWRTLLFCCHRYRAADQIC
jgi:hypothetical protein